MQGQKKRLLCRLGIHRYMDLQRNNEHCGQDAVEECVLCGAHRYVFRPFWGKDGPMHPRIENRQA